MSVEAQRQAAFRAMLDEWLQAPSFEPGGPGSIHCPVADCVERYYRATNGVVHLNDDHKWTREAIADWLEESGLNLTCVLERAKMVLTNESTS